MSERVYVDRYKLNKFIAPVIAAMPYEAPGRSWVISDKIYSFLRREDGLGWLPAPGSVHSPSVWHVRYNADEGVPESAYDAAKGERGLHVLLIKCRDCDLEKNLGTEWREIARIDTTGRLHVAGLYLDEYPSARVPRKEEDRN